MTGMVRDTQTFGIVKYMNYKGEQIELVDSSQVTAGVTCEVYKFTNSEKKDLGKVFVKAGHKTPKQKVLQGEKTIESFEKGQGTLTIISSSGAQTEYLFPGDVESVDVKIGETMQWEAYEDLVFNEICWPPYQDGRFENL